MLTAMTDASAVATSASAEDPAVGLRAVASLRVLADSLEELQVARARALGWTWQQVADALGITRQAVHQKYRHHGL